MPIGALLVFTLAGHGIQVGLDKPCEPHLKQRYGLQESGEKIALSTYRLTLDIGATHWMIIKETYTGCFFATGCYRTHGVIYSGRKHSQVHRRRCLQRRCKAALLKALQSSNHLGHLLLTLQK